MEISLKGRHALVCGASAGIGQATAIQLANLGATVTVLARNHAKLQSLRPILMHAGAPETHMLAADLADHGALEKGVRGLLESSGPIHILVNNSGGPSSGALLDAEPEEFVAAFHSHLLASHLLTRLVVPGMKQAGYGRIVNVLSTSVREPIPGLGVSGTVRSAMASWAKTLSRELPPGITINSVLPGYTETERLGELAHQMATRQGKAPSEVSKGWVAVTPEGRLGQPEELGAVIAFLCSPAASFIRGTVIPVDGGRLASI